jgi:hypothetical protein
MPSNAPLDWLLSRLVKLIQAATDALEQSYPHGVGDWQQEVSRQLARYHAAALLAGADTGTLSNEARVKVTADLAAQLRWLERFGIEIQDGETWKAGWNSRAASYANSIKIPYWRGAVKLLPLPAMPAEGTNCYGNCGCAWEVNELDGDGNADAYWRRAKDDSCGVCIQRERDWSPVRIRSGVLQL